MVERLTTFTCWICSKSMPLEQIEHETQDALGYPVHKACYTRLLKEEKAKQRKAGSGSP